MRRKIKSFKKAKALLESCPAPFRIRHGKEWNDYGDLCRSQIIIDADGKERMLILTSAHKADVYVLGDKTCTG
jgi:hypothetical protein